MLGTETKDISRSIEGGAWERVGEGLVDGHAWCFRVGIVGIAELLVCLCDTLSSKRRPSDISGIKDRLIFLHTITEWREFRT